MNDNPTFTKTEEDIRSEAADAAVEPELFNIVQDFLVDLVTTNNSTSRLLDENKIITLIQACIQILKDQPALLELSAPISIVGDIHGQFVDLLRLFEVGGFPGDTNYLFLGDFVDRANQGVEVMVTLMCYKIKYPERFFMLRGNHECASLTRIYGFYDECRKRYSVKLWRNFTSLFNILPLAAVVEDKIFCVHGGLSPELVSLADVLQIERPQGVPEEGLVCDLLWADPDPYVDGWSENPRGVSYTFGDDVIHDFLDTHDLDLVVRAHQVVEDGYEFNSDRSLVTIFSAPNYCGEFDNAGAIMVVDESLTCSFRVLRPMSHLKRIQQELSSFAEIEDEEDGSSSNASAESPNQGEAEASTGSLEGTL